MCFPPFPSDEQVDFQLVFKQNLIGVCKSMSVLFQFHKKIFILNCNRVGGICLLTDEHRILFSHLSYWNRKIYFGWNNSRHFNNCLKQKYSKRFDFAQTIFSKTDGQTNLQNLVQHFVHR